MDLDDSDAALFNRLSGSPLPVLSIADLLELIREQIQLQRANLYNTTADECSSNLNMTVVYEYALIPAIFMILIACFTVKRAELLPNFLNKRPGLTYPMNILEERSVRLSYALAFGISAQLCYDLLFGDSDLFKLHITSRPTGPFKFLHVLYRFCEVCLYCTVMYPIFLAISKRSRLFFAMGTLYVWTFTALSIARLAMVDCSEVATETQLTFALKYLPSVLCTLGLSIILPYKLIETTFSKRANISNSEYVYQYEYVRELIKAKPPNSTPEAAAQRPLLQRIRAQFKRLRYTRRNGFRYSPRIICTYTAVAIVIYMVTYNIVNEVHYWHRVLSLLLVRIENLANKIGGDTGQSVIEQLNILRIYIHTVYAIALQIVAFFGLLICLSIGLFDPVNRRLRQWFVEFIEYTWPLGVVSGTLLLAQFILVKLAFNSKYSTMGKIAINNRHVYFNWAYFMFYFNVFWGIVAAVFQLVAAAVLAVCFLSRLDWCFFPKRFEFLDEGHFAYVGLLYIENAHTNPVMRTFLALLLDSTAERRRGRCHSRLVGFALKPEQADEFHKEWLRDPSFSASPESAGDVRFEVSRSINAKIRARNRWFLALTLARNPALQQQRRHYIKRFNDLLKRRRSVFPGRSLDGQRGSRDLGVAEHVSEL
uniref:Receptor for retinol uptake STRA6 n=1 Tax=Macrostomum lignano TaxID=282301 RepID=A0A1I8HVM9_9PLAT